MTLDAQQGTILSWTAPQQPGAHVIVYDAIRSTAPNDFTTNAFCIESNDATDTLAYDADTPDLGAAYHYLVRAQHACGTGLPTLPDCAE